MKILAIDTSAKVASTALFDGRKMIAQWYLDAGFTHSETLLPMIDSLLSFTSYSLEEIDALAVSCGPGSFTGLRIGISAVKGIAQAMGKPCIPISTLEAAAYLCMGLSLVVCPVMDARREQLYAAAFEIEGMQVKRLVEDEAVDAISFIQKMKGFSLKKQLYFMGDGAALCLQKANELGEDLHIMPPHLCMQQAAGVGLAAVMKGETGIEAKQLQPFYLRISQAERMRNEQLKKEGF